MLLIFVGVLDGILAKEALQYQHNNNVLTNVSPMFSVLEQHFSS